nr:immunoglobulin heavy chain junction region [Mus musculus]
CARGTYGNYESWFAYW